MLQPNVKDTTGECFITGMQSEVTFQQLAESRGWTVTPATKHQNMIEHFDYVLTTAGGARMTVEVKAQKKIRRSDKSFSDAFVWIEFFGITGHKGWLFGKADYIAFERKDEYWLIPRSRLVKRVTMLVSYQLVHSPVYALYKLYRRSGRQDAVTLVKSSDIEDLAIKYSKDMVLNGTQN
jgi:hypothetical protein